MNHAQVLKAAISALPAERASFLSDLGSFLEEQARFEPIRHWMFMVLAAGCELVPMVLPKQVVAQTLETFVNDNILEIQKVAYSRDYVIKHGQPMAELATVFAGMLSEIALDKYQSGELKPDEPDAHLFSWPHYDANAFPYHDDEEDEDEEDY